MMSAFIADALTLSRLVAAAVLVWLGMLGPRTLDAALAVTVAAWTTDQLDGWFARRATTPTKLAPADFAIDTVLYGATLTYLTSAGFVSLQIAVAIVAATALLWLIYRRKAMVVVGVRAVDVASLVVVFKYRPWLGLALFGWLGLLGIIYRRRVVERLPRWLGELKELFKTRLV